MAEGQRPEGVVVVTGAAGGMGSASVRRLAEEGWNEFLLCDVSEERLEEVAGPLRAEGARADILAGDIAEPAFAAMVVSRLAGRPVAALVHTAGIAPGQGSPERILAINLDGTVHMVNALREHMAPGSAIVLYASNSSYFPMPPEAAAAFTQPLPAGGALALAHLAPSPEAAYPLAKLAVRALVKREAKPFGDRGVRIMSISPGVIDTPMTRGTLAEGEGVKQMIAVSGCGRIGQAEELAAVTAFLCSPAASFVTGADWLVDGGEIAGMGF